LEVGEVTPDPFDDLRLMIEIADPLDLELRPPSGGNKWSADLMSKADGRPSIGVQGRILDAMDDGRITRPEANKLLNMVRERLRPGVPGISVVDDDGNLTPIRMEVVDGTRP
jgi:hypothetical protein